MHGLLSQIYALLLNSKDVILQEPTRFDLVTLPWNRHPVYYRCLIYKLEKINLIKHPQFPFSWLSLLLDCLHPFRNVGVILYILLCYRLQWLRDYIRSARCPEAPLIPGAPVELIWYLILPGFSALLQVYFYSVLLHFSLPWSPFWMGSSCNYVFSSETNNCHVLSGVNENSKGENAAKL